MDGQIGLFVAVEIVPLHTNSTGHRRLEDGGLDELPLPRNLTRTSYADRDDPHLSPQASGLSPALSRVWLPPLGGRELPALIFRLKPEATHTSDSQALSPQPSALSPSADVDSRAPKRIGFVLPENLAGYRRRIAFSERQELQQIRDRIAFRPTEVGVRHLTGPIANV